jgi:peptidoglycan/xylan/chitin deacetylase (PgdA/CDA1 family)
MTAVLLALVGSGCGNNPAPSAHKPAQPASATARSGATGPEDLTDQQLTAGLVRFAAKHRPVYCGGRAKPWVAFTFDDGPGPYTKHVVEILKHFRAPPTWFVVGRNVAPYKSSLTAERKIGPVGDHSWSHPLLTSLPAGQAKTQIGATAKAIHRAGAPKVQLFRPPYGAHNRTIDAIARRDGMVQVLWNVDSEDALGANHKEISKNVIKGLRPGSIVLMHENRGQTIRALKFKILPHMKKTNIKLVTVPQMLAGNPPTAKQLARGRKGCR